MGEGVNDGVEEMSCQDFFREDTSCNSISRRLTVHIKSSVI